MSNCLVTKLKSSVNDSSLPKLGRLVIEFESNSEGSYVYLVFGADSTVKVVEGSVDEFPSGEISFAANATATLHYSGVLVLDIPKYNLVTLGVSQTNIKTKLDLKDLSYNLYPYKTLRFTSGNNALSGDVANLRNSALTGLTIKSINIYGDLTPLFESSAHTGDYAFDYETYEAGKNLVGDCSKLFAPGARINNFQVNNTGLKLNITEDTDLSSVVLFSFSFCRDNNPTDIAILRKLPNLTTTPVLRGSNFYGDVSNFNYLRRHISKIFLTSSIKGNDFSGDLATLEDRFAMFSAGRQDFEDGTFFYADKLRWITTRPSSAYIMALEAVVLKTEGDVDRMLINQANCTPIEEINDPSTENWKKTIAVYGVRTSASDQAVQTLTNKGYIVTVSPIPAYLLND